MGRMATQSPLNAASRIIRMLLDNTIGRTGGILAGSLKDSLNPVEYFLLVRLSYP